MQGTMPGARRRGRPRTAWVDNIKTWIGLPVEESVRMTEDGDTHPLNGPLSGTTQVSRYQKVKTNLDFTEARDSQWQWHQLGHMQVCTSLPTDNHASTPPLSFLQAGCPSCHPTDSVKALKAQMDGETASTVRPTLG